MELFGFLLHLSFEAFDQGFILPLEEHPDLMNDLSIVVGSIFPQQGPRQRPIS